MIKFFTLACGFIISCGLNAQRIQYFQPDENSQITKTIPVEENLLSLESNTNLYANFVKELKTHVQNHSIEFIFDHSRETEGELQVHYEIRHIKLYGFSAKAFLLKNNSIYVVGSFPKINRIQNIENLDNHLESSHFVKMHFKNPTLQFLSHSRYYYLENSVAIPVWNFKVREGIRVYEVLANSEKIFTSTPLYFDADIMGKMQVYTGVARHSPLDIVQEPVVGDGTLTNEFFVTDTLLNPYVITPRAVSHNSVFVYQTNDVRFPEVSSFVYAMQAKKFFEKFSYKWDQKGLFVLSLHNIFEGSSNNASYYPPNSSPYRQATILFGDGDGVTYGNFATDVDIVTHEFAHHIIYKTLNPSTEEGSVLHEGISDYFAEAKANDPCFAASILLMGSNCLRSASNKVEYTSSFYKTSEIHLKSLAISGLLWDLRTLIGKDGDFIVYNSLSYLNIHSGIKDFLQSLLIADQQLYSGAHACLIVNKAEDRKFNTFLTDINCNDYSKAVSNPTYVSTPPVSNTASKQKCGSSPLTSIQNTILLLIYTLPLILPFLLRRTWI